MAHAKIPLLSRFSLPLRFANPLPSSGSKRESLIRRVEGEEGDTSPPSPSPRAKRGERGKGLRARRGRWRNKQSREGEGAFWRGDKVWVDGGGRKGRRREGGRLSSAEGDGEEIAILLGDKGN